MKKERITKRQLDLFNAIKKLTEQNGVPPTIAELKHSLGVSSDQSVYQLLQRLSSAGLITRERGKKRSIRLVNDDPNALGQIRASSPIIPPGKVMDPTHKKIANKLYELDPQLADIYRGAIFTMSQKGYHPDWMAQTAHSLRNMFDILARRSSMPQDDKNKDRGEDEVGTTRISRAFDPHGDITKVEKILWASWNKINRYFVKVAHYDTAYQSKQEIEIELPEKVEELNKLLIEYILPDQSEIYERLDQIIRSGPDQVVPDELRKRLRNIASYTYFFKSIDSQWFDYLKSNKQLLPTFPVGEYLVLIAPDIPEKVINLIKYYNDEYRLKDHEKFIRRFFVLAVNQMPYDYGIKMVNIIDKQKWIQTSINDHDPMFYDAKTLLEKLLNHKKYRSAVNLSNQILSVKEPGDRSKSLRGVESYVGEYLYEEIIKTIKTISANEIPPFVQVVITKLNEAIKISREEGKYLYIWRSSIGNEDKLRHSVIDVIIDGIRDLSSTYLTSLDNNDIGKTIESWFSGFDHDIFVRIKLYLLRKFAKDCKEQIQLAIIKYFDEDHISQEYVGLVKQEFGNIDKSFRKKYLELVAKGSKDQEHSNDKEFHRRWKLRKLVIIQPFLNKQWQKIYQNLLGKDKASLYKSIDRSEGVTWSGPTSPNQPAELDSMPIRGLVDYLVSWKPKGDFGEPSRVGLGRTLADAVKNDPIKYSKSASVFDNAQLRPVYLYQYFSGLKGAVDNKSTIKWEPVMELMMTLVNNAKKDCLAEFQLDKNDWEANWNSVFQYMVSLLESGFSSTEAIIPFSLRLKVWAIIEYICENPEPDLEYEEKYGGENSDFYTLSINTVRGQAFHALFNYVFWCDRNLKTRSSFSRIPNEAKKVLETHLDVDKEPGLTMRSVYGRFFPWLYTYDKVWTRQIIPRLFPIDNQELPRRYAAWETYLINAVYPNLFEDLRPQYEKAITELKQSSLAKNRRIIDVFERLIGHLIVAYAYDVIQYKDPLIKQFYREANHGQKGVAVNFAGRVYIASEDSARGQQPNKDRLKSFWNMRLKEDGSLEELKEFGWWIKAGYFDDQWMLKMLLATLTKTKGIIDPNFRVLEVLEQLADTHSRLVSQCLLKMVKAQYQDRFLQLTRESHIINIVKQLYQNRDEQVRDTIVQISDQMLRLGNDDFREYAKAVPKIPTLKK